MGIKFWLDDFRLIQINAVHFGAMPRRHPYPFSTGLPSAWQDRMNLDNPLQERPKSVWSLFLRIFFAPAAC